MGECSSPSLIVLLQLMMEVSYWALPERDSKAWLTWIKNPVATRDHLMVGRVDLDTLPVVRLQLDDQQDSNPLSHQPDASDHMPVQSRVSFKIETNFNRSHKENKRHPNGRAVGEANIEWTQYMSDALHHKHPPYWIYINYRRRCCYHFLLVSMLT